LRYQRIVFFCSNPEHEILWKACGVPFDSFVKTKGRYAVQLCQIGVQHDAVSPDVEDPLGDILCPKEWF
jgi:hypothetical protein